MDKNQMKEIQQNFITVCESIGDTTINSFTSNRKEDGIYKVQLTEIGLNRFVHKHTQDGYVIISASRDESTSEENQEQTQKLQSAIKSAGYSYIPVDGGFIENQGTDKEQEVIEQSFIIPITKRDKTGNLDELFELGKNLSNEFHQESFLFGDGQKVGEYRANGTLKKSLGSGLKLNDTLQTFFTKLRGSDKTNQADRRFTFENQIYFHGKGSYCTNYGRWVSGEIQLWL